jgi:hypothetical protein
MDLAFPGMDAISIYLRGNIRVQEGRNNLSKEEVDDTKIFVGKSHLIV